MQSYAGFNQVAQQPGVGFATGYAQQAQPMQTSNANNNTQQSASSSKFSQSNGVGEYKGETKKGEVFTDIRIALVCQSNLNRSMESHHLLKERGYTVWSYGAGSKIRLPGETPYKPNIYDFGTSYEFILGDLKKKNQQRYSRNGMLAMLERDKKVKTKPERWQDEKSHFDLVITYESRVFDVVVQDIESRATNENRPVHIINLDTPDSHSDANIGAKLTHQLIDKLQKSDDWENVITEVLDTFEKDNGKPVLHTVLFY